MKFAMKSVAERKCQALLSVGCLKQREKQEVTGHHQPQVPGNDKRHVTRRWAERKGLHKQGRIGFQTQDLEWSLSTLLTPAEMVSDP